MKLFDNCYKHTRTEETTKTAIPVITNINLNNDISTFAKLNINMLDIIADTHNINFFCHNGKIQKTICN